MDYIIKTVNDFITNEDSYINLIKQYSNEKKQLLSVINNVLNSKLCRGDEVEKFEKIFTKGFKKQNIVLC